MLLSTSLQWWDALALSVGLSLIYGLLRRFLGRATITKLSGPKRTSWLFGYNRDLLLGNSGELFEGWANDFGRVFRIPTALGSDRTVFFDPRAIAHILNGNGYNFWRPEGNRAALHTMLGGGVLTVEGEEHKKQRRALSPGFTPQAIRQFSTIFLEAAHKVSDHWTNLLADNKTGQLVINVEPWLNSISLDSIGLAGFSHNFNCVHGERPAVVSIFESFGTIKFDFISILTLTLVQAIPSIVRAPSNRNNLVRSLHGSMADIAQKLLSERKGEMKGNDDSRSMVASLIKAENKTLTQDDVIAQMNTLILAGFETTSTSLSWCLHELSTHLGVQEKLREELTRFPEPTFEQLSHDMTFLDAVVKETLRTHPAVPENHRVAVSADSIPLASPLTTADGRIVDHIDVKAGTGIIIPIEAINRSELIWGPHAHDFDPERWLSGDLPKAAQDIQGFHHLLTFIDGPRHCIGKNFAVAEFKAVLAVLVRKFAFTPLHGKGEDVVRRRSITLRPRNQDEDGLLLHVRPIEA